MTPDGRRSLLELLLPGGAAARAVVIGSACPDRLRPSASSATEAGPVELAVVAPGPEERGGLWLDHAVDVCSARLAPDGIAYLLLPRRDRVRAWRALRGRGLEIGPALLHLPNAALTRDLVPVRRVALVHAAPSAGWKRRLARAAYALGGARLLALASPRVGVVARRPGARPLLAWMDSDGEQGYDAAWISSTWRSEGSSAIVRPFRRGREAAVVAKVALTEADAGPREEERLRRLAPAASSAGARVPQVVRRVDLGGAAGLVETRVDGRLAAPLLTDHAVQLDDVLGPVCGWLERFGAATARREPVTRERLERELLEPASVLKPLLADGDAYLRALAERCDRVAGTEVVLTAAHNDLTMWNVLIHRDGIGVLDWEAAEEAALPLKDLFYATVDAVAAATGYADRPAAARECLTPAGARARWVDQARARMADRLGVEPGLAELSLHSCWVGHAANEHRAAGEGDARPFLEIARWLATTLAP
jgi:hypothetical protein